MKVTAENYSDPSKEFCSNRIWKYKNMHCVDCPLDPEDTGDCYHVKAGPVQYTALQKEIERAEGKWE